VVPSRASMQTPRIKVVDVLKLEPPRTDLRVKGWLRTVRDNKQVVFLEINDGSCLANVQAVCGPELSNYEEVRKLTTGSAVEVVAELVASPAAGQRVELKATEVIVVGVADPSFPLQKKRHSMEYLRTIAHLRARSNTFGAVFRVRSRMAQAVHEFFGSRGFVYVHTPIITASDCEGAGEMFRVSTLDPEKLPRTSDGKIDYAQDFFSRSSYLTVSGQLNGETFAHALSDIYTFGPTFRAENSNTARHAAEFWMIEPEMAWCDLDGCIETADAFVRHLIRTALEHCEEDLKFFSGERLSPGLIDRLELVANKPSARMTYTEAVKVLEGCGQKFEYPVRFGVSLQAEHERYLAETHVGGPVFVTDYPKDFKAFYMRRNDDGITVAATDMLVPRIGELIGGSQREERLDVLERVMKEHSLNTEDYSWYLDTRRFGTVPHAGFGLGFERLVMYVTGMENIRDVVPFPRTPRSCDF
jgi:asparaginyl-tRNA synthetase